MNTQTIKNYLTENPSVAVETAREINGWDGSFPFVDIWDLSELINCFCCDYKSTRDFMNVILNSLDTLSPSTETVRFSEYGDWIEEVTEEQIEEEVIDYIDEIVDRLEELYPSRIDIYDDDFKELLETEEEEKNS